VTQIATEAGHWYSPTGEPCYTIIGKNGNERPTTLRDAREFDLAPSVSAIIKCAATDALTYWQITQALLSSVALPRIDGESDEAFILRARTDARVRSEEVRDLGSHIHGCIEKCLLGQEYDDDFEKHVTAALYELGTFVGPLSTIRAEKSFCHHLGFGGKCDVHKKPEIDVDEAHPGFVVDFKTKDFDADNLPLAYDNHAMQLAAYREGFDMPDARCAIIFVSTKVPGLTHLVEIDQGELNRGWEMFQCLLEFWQLQKRYHPNGKDFA
jgi:hypothetical protein